MKNTETIEHNLYDWMDLVKYNQKIICLCFKWINFLVYNWFYDEFVINRELYFNTSKALFEKVKKFFHYYLWKTIKNRKDFINFVNECTQRNGKFIKKYDCYTSNWLLLF